MFVAAFYWDQNSETWAFSERFKAIHGAMPTMFQASVYGATMHCLKAIDAAGTDEAHAVMAQMRATPTNDFITENGSIREDGRVIRDLYLRRVKTLAESTCKLVHR